MLFSQILSCKTSLHRMMNQLWIQISSAFNRAFCKSSKYIYKYMTICKTNQDWASIYKCRNLRSNLDCNLLSHIIEISPTASLTGAAARERGKDHMQQPFRSANIFHGFNVLLHMHRRLLLFQYISAVQPITQWIHAGESFSSHITIQHSPQWNQKKRKKHSEPDVTSEVGVTNSRAGGD